MRIDYTFTNAKCGGFGTLGKGILRELKAAGHQITSDHPDILFGYGVPSILDTLRGRNKVSPLVYYTVWESSIYPEDWVKKMKEVGVALVLTATEFTKKSLIRAGWDGPIEVWHHGIDSRWEFKERRDDDVFTFLHYNAYEWRKGWDIVLRAFVEEFSPDENVELIFKARERDYANWLAPPNDPTIPLPFPHIKELIGFLSDQEMVEMMESADCGVFPVHGEGWFLPATECVAQGIPVIMPNKMAMSEQWNSGCIDLEIDGYINVSPRYPGYMIQPSVEDLKKKMRWCYNNVQTCKELGKKGSEEVHSRFNWKKIIRDLEEHLNSVK